MKPLGPCRVCELSHWRCTCPYFHLARLPTPFILKSHLDFSRTAEQIAAEQHPTEQEVVGT